MKGNKDVFLQKFFLLNYEEQRQIRTYLAKNIDLRVYSIEVLEIDSYQLMKKAS